MLPRVTDDDIADRCLPNSETSSNRGLRPAFGVKSLNLANLLKVELRLYSAESPALLKAVACVVARRANKNMLWIDTIRSVAGMAAVILPNQLNAVSLFKRPAMQES